MSAKSPPSSQNHQHTPTPEWRSTPSASGADPALDFVLASAPTQGQNTPLVIPFSSAPSTPSPAPTTSDPSSPATNNGATGLAPTSVIPSASGSSPLPAGWEKRQALDGRPYYVNHNTKSTSWEDPRTAASMAPTSTTSPSTPNTNPAGLSPLAAGWEKRQTSEGRPYYVDHNTKTTSWVEPKTEAESSPLPAGWERRKTAKGHLYFVDHNTHTTTWLQPRATTATTATTTPPKLKQ
ncbi:hypothetical protein EMPS_09980 [Entomortierella parvispora]|uniref:WW domain-containing protein n=1 Tax=Entomortierella parvispora TaxID=205924 RepID=A0A9P3M0J9_9FUNG|nr:hypothetical protein EMPS_09980 [Entomortierella parvispora]